MSKNSDAAYQAGFRAGRESAIFVISTFASNGQQLTQHATHVNADGGGFQFTAPEGYLITRVHIDAAAGPKERANRTSGPDIVHVDLVDDTVTFYDALGVERVAGPTYGAPTPTDWMFTDPEAGDV